MRLKEEKEKNHGWDKRASRIAYIYSQKEEVELVLPTKVCRRQTGPTGHVSVMAQPDARNKETVMMKDPLRGARNREVAWQPPTHWKRELWSAPSHYGSMWKGKYVHIWEYIHLFEKGKSKSLKRGLESTKETQGPKKWKTKIVGVRSNLSLHSAQDNAPERSNPREWISDPRHLYPSKCWILVQ